MEKLGKVVTMAVREQYVVDAKGRKTAVLLSLEQYERRLEDLHDLAVVAERRDEEPISLKELKRRLKKDGLI
ncbi:MAG TPA: type II toxin-antitoxin system Phd/YefM family antitoxin [Pyrinomonadaceae bacterium]|nr:type II toxin-antitoxin system Phd/YefM family antitoxin [Pyrinomonadaceae bacterium]